MSRFPTAAHLASWAYFAPGVKQSAGRNKGNGTTGHGNRYLARALGEAAVAASRRTPPWVSGTGASPNAVPAPGPRRTDAEPVISFARPRA
jgi:transposase